MAPPSAFAPAHAALAQQNADAVGHRAFERADDRHLEAGGPPGADGDERLGRADGEVGGERDDGGGDDRLDTAEEEEGNDGDGGADGRGERAGAGRDEGVGERLLGGAEPLAGQGAQQLLGVAGDVVDHVLRVFLGQSLHLVVEREEFAGLGAVHLDGFALADDLGVVDFALALGGQIGAGAHAESRGDHAGEAGEEDVFAVAGGGAGDAGDDAEDGAEAVVDAVDGVADPAAGLLAALVALGQHLFENGLGVDLGRAGGGGIVAAQERSQLAVVILFVLDDVLEDGDRIPRRRAP